MNAIDKEKIEVKLVSNYGKRLIAIIIDFILLGLLGIILGFLFTNTFILLGWKGRFIGFGITLIYFSLFNSHILQGQTFGQKIVKIKVVNSKIENFSFLQSIIRSVFLPTIILLNNWTLPLNPNSFFIKIIAFVLFSVIFLEIYYFLFSGKSKQLLHDVIVDSYVVDIKANKENLQIQRINKKVLKYSFAPIILVIITIFLTTLLAKQTTMTELIKIQSDLQNNYNLHHVSVYSGSTTSATLGHETSTTKYLRISCIKKSQFEDDNVIAKKIITVLKKYSITKEIDLIEFYYVTGYDIGIASKWKSTSQKYSNIEFIEISKE